MISCIEFKRNQVYADFCYYREYSNPKYGDYTYTILNSIMKDIKRKQQKR